MRMIVGVIVVVVLLAAGLAVISGNGIYKTQDTSSKSITYWTGQITVHIGKFKCDPSLDLIGDPDPYFVVFINDKEIKSKVWNNQHEIDANWNATATITTRDPAVWIEISAWDKDSGLYGRDDLIDIDPTDGFSLDLIYNLQTHTWAGDVSGNNASGNRPYDWGDIWFDITSTPESKSVSNVQLPFSGYGRINPQVDDSTKSSTPNYKIYNFKVEAHKTISVTMQPNPNADYALYLYGPDNKEVAYSDMGGKGVVERIYTTAKTSGIYTLKVVDVSGYGAYSLNINTKAVNTLDARLLKIGMEKDIYVLSRDWANINIRAMGYYMSFLIYNPTSVSGVVHIHFFNVDPDYLVTNFENETTRGKYSLTIDLHLNASQAKTVDVQPWYVPSDNFWVFAMGDNRPGCGIYDHPYNQGPEFTTFMYYYTNVIRTPIGWDDGDLVAGFGGALVTEWKGISVDAMDYVYDMEYNRFYMLSGTHDVFFFTTVGNHDVTRHPDQPEHAGEHIYEEYLGNLYYSFNYSNTHFVFPDDYQDGFWHHGNWSFGKGETPWWYGSDGTYNYGGYIYGKQLVWLKHDLAASQSYTHRVVVMHMPIIPPPSRQDNLNDGFSNYTDRSVVMNIFKDYRVDYLVVAHIHNYTYYYTNYDDGKVTSSMTPQGQYSIFTLLTGGAGAHNAYQDWGVPAIEGSYHFVLIHIDGGSITYHVYKYENLTDSNGNPLTSVVYEGANDGSETDAWGVVHNNAIYNFPYIRMKFYMSPDKSDYVAYSKELGTFQHVYEHKFKDYTVVYVDTSAPAHMDNEVHVYSASSSPATPEFSSMALPLLVILVIIVAAAFRRK